VSTTPGEVTQILIDIRSGNPNAHDRLMPLVYAELRRIAAAHLRKEAANHSLQPTAIVNEAYIRLVEINRVDWQGRGHFFAVASGAMRRILVDHARATRAEKRGGGVETCSFDEALVAFPGRSPDVLALDDALHRLSQLDARQAKIVEMMFFSGMTEEETGDALAISSRTVKRDWRIAKAWLYKELSP
jgi:RNA polymerase sigma factor (TIGR02999 family)